MSDVRPPRRSEYLEIDLDSTVGLIFTDKRYEIYPVSYDPRFASLDSSVNDKNAAG